MNHTKIEWVQNPDGTPGYTWNPITGCLNHDTNGLCKGGGFPCYAYRLAHGRLKARYTANEHIVRMLLSPEGGWPVGYSPYKDPFYPRFWPERLEEPYRVKKPAGIFLDDMADWMGDYWPEEWTEAEFQMMRDNPQHRIYTLTKQPQNLPKWSPFPNNCWVGVTVTSNGMMTLALESLASVQAAVKFISFEPLLGSIGMSDHMGIKGIVDWFIIGACTGTRPDMLDLIKRNPGLTLMPYGKIWTAQPKIEWVREIVGAADKAGIPVFLKNNLSPLFFKTVHQIPLKWGIKPDGELRQEMPKEVIKSGQ